MNKLFIILLFLSNLTFAQDFKKLLTKQLKFSTIYGSVNGGTSLSDVKTFSITSGQLKEGIVPTPYDYSITIGIRK